MAALPAYRPLVRRLRGQAPRHAQAARCGDFRHARPFPEGPVFKLAVARRPHRASQDGRYAILDYKTGQVPTAPQVRTGLAPQLTLEAAILRAGRFGTVPKGASIAEFVYVSLRGVDPPGKGSGGQDGRYDARRLADLTALARSPAWSPPSTTRRRPKLVRASGRCSCAAIPGDYDHLARVKEWSLSGDATKARATANERAPNLPKLS